MSTKYVFSAVYWLVWAGLGAVCVVLWCCVCGAVVLCATARRTRGAKTTTIAKASREWPQGVLALCPRASRSRRTSQISAAHLPQATPAHPLILTPRPGGAPLWACNLPVRARVMASILCFLPSPARITPFYAHRFGFRESRSILVLF